MTRSHQKIRHLNLPLSQCPPQVQQTSGRRRAVIVDSWLGWFKGSLCQKLEGLGGSSLAMPRNSDAATKRMNHPERDDYPVVAEAVELFGMEGSGLKISGNRRGGTLLVTRRHEPCSVAARCCISGLPPTEESKFIKPSRRSKQIFARFRRVPPPYIRILMGM